ncbi:MAG: hypothetical protein QOE38_2481, partial [Thermoleophilaceae bacterium]|nr:hypothetical protein [Thermoleophilaceae bacterium]
SGSAATGRQRITIDAFSLGDLDSGSSAFPAGRVTGIQAQPPERSRQIIALPEPEKKPGLRSRPVLVGCLVLAVLLAGAAATLALTGVFGGHSRAADVQQAKQRSRNLLTDTSNLTREMTSLAHQARAPHISSAQKKRIVSRLGQLRQRAKQIQQKASKEPTKPGGNDPAVRLANRLIHQIANGDVSIVAKLEYVVRHPKDPGNRALIRSAIAEAKTQAGKGRTAGTTLDLPGPAVTSTPPRTPAPEAPRPQVHGADSQPQPAWSALPGGPAGLDTTGLSPSGATFDGNLLAPIVVFPSGGTDAAAGCDSGQLDTWSLGDSGWNQVSTAHSPPACPVGSIAFDSVNAETVLVLAPPGGSTQTWLFDGNDWRDASPATPPASAGPMAFDESSNELVMAGLGSEPTVAWDGTDWSQIGDGTGIDAASLAYSPSDQALVAVGSPSGGGDTQTLLFDGTTWNDSGAADQPPSPGALASDGSDLVFLPAADPAGTSSFEQWRFAASSWTHDAASDTPPPGLAPLATTVDPATGSRYVIGFEAGADPVTAKPQTWVYESSAVKRCSGDTGIDSLSPSGSATDVLADGVDCATARDIATSAPATLGNAYSASGFSCSSPTPADGQAASDPAAVHPYECTSGGKVVRFTAAK